MVEKEKQNEACRMATLYFLAGNSRYLGAHLLYLISSDNPTVFRTGIVSHRRQEATACLVSADRGAQLGWKCPATLGAQAETTP